MRADGKIVGYVVQNRTGWRFYPTESITLMQPTGQQETLKGLGEVIALATGGQKIRFHEMPRPIKAKSKRSTRSKKREKPKEAEEEGLTLEREHAKFSPRTSSLETRGIIVGLPMSGGLPGLGKRR